MQWTQPRNINHSCVLGWIQEPQPGLGDIMVVDNPVQTDERHLLWKPPIIQENLIIRDPRNTGKAHFLMNDICLVHTLKYSEQHF